MRNLYIQKIITLCLLVFLTNATVFSCNLSNYTLTSITGTGPYTIVTRLCVGYGVTGAVRGADQATRTISFGFYSSAGTVTISSFSPASITSGRGFSNCTMTGANIGTQGSPYNSQGTIIYIDPGYYGIVPCVAQPFGCITSTALCGNVAQQCIDYTFVTNIRPDSIRAFGVEGAGNPVAGCMPNPDMIIDFTLLLPVFWSTVNARKINNNEVAINWTTLSEVNNYFFTIEKTDKLAEGLNHHSQQVDETIWTQCGIVNGTNNNTATSYSFVDKTPFPELSYYRVKQTDFSGKFSYSRIVVVSSFNEREQVKIYPNPVKDLLTIEAENLKSILLINMLGKKIYESKIISDKINTINTQNIPKGIYLLKLEATDGNISTSKIKITD